MSADGGRCEVFGVIFKVPGTGRCARNCLKTIAETVPKSSDQPENRAENVPNVEKPYGKPSEEPFKR
jgi:hypothetical protein